MSILKERYFNMALAAAMIVLLLAAFLPLVEIKAWWLRYVFAAAAVAIVVIRILQRVAYRKRQMSLRLRRLLTLEFWSGMCYLFSALFLFSDPYHSTWLGFLTAGAVVQVYASFMIDRQQRKDAQEKGGI